MIFYFLSQELQSVQGQLIAERSRCFKLEVVFHDKTNEPSPNKLGRWENRTDDPKFGLKIKYAPPFKMQVFLLFHYIILG